MKIKPQVVVVGLGRFGTSFASKMYQLGYDVMAIVLKSTLSGVK